MDFRIFVSFFLTYERHQNKFKLTELMCEIKRIRFLKNFSIACTAIEMSTAIFRLSEETKVQKANYNHSSPFFMKIR